MKLNYVFSATCALAAASLVTGCYQSSDTIQRRQQEVILKEATAQTGMPAIKNFRERKLMKKIIEDRDQTNLNTYTYLYAEATGEIKFFCNSIGFAIPYATQYTNPQKYESASGTTLPQADPSGLFPPESAEASWVMCKTPSGGIEPLYVEPKVIVTTYKL